MKLIFTKRDDGEPDVKLAKGTVEEDFSYVELIKGLLERQQLDLQFGDSISQEEIEKIEEMVGRINSTIKEQLDTEG